MKNYKYSLSACKPKKYSMSLRGLDHLIYYVLHILYPNYLIKYKNYKYNHILNLLNKAHIA